MDNLHHAIGTDDDILTKLHKMRAKTLVLIQNTDMISKTNSKEVALVGIESMDIIELSMGLPGTTLESIKNKQGDLEKCYNNCVKLGIIEPS